MEKKGVTLHNLICNMLKNTSDEFDFQEAHQDYFLKVISIKVPNYTKLHLAWSAIIPMKNKLEMKRSDDFTPFIPQETNNEAFSCVFFK